MPQSNTGDSIDTGQRFETPSISALNQLIQTIHRMQQHNIDKPDTITILAFQPSEYHGCTAGHLIQGVTQPELEQLIINQTHTS